MNDSISKSWYKNLSHHWISDINEFVVVWLVTSCRDFLAELKTIFLKVLLPKQRFRGSSLATATIKVCLKYIGEHRVPARKQRRALEALLRLTFESSRLTHILWTLSPSRVPDAYSSSELSKPPLSLRMPELCEMKRFDTKSTNTSRILWVTLYKKYIAYHLWYSWHAHNLRRDYDSGHLRATVFQGILRCHPASCLLTDSTDSAI